MGNYYVGMIWGFCLGINIFGILNNKPTFIDGILITIVFILGVILVPIWRYGDKKDKYGS